MYYWIKSILSVNQIKEEAYKFIHPQKLTKKFYQ